MRSFVLRRKWLMWRKQRSLFCQVHGWLTNQAGAQQRQEVLTESLTTLSGCRRAACRASKKTLPIILRLLKKRPMPPPASVDRTYGRRVGSCSGGNPPFPQMTRHNWTPCTICRLPMVHILVTKTKRIPAGDDSILHLPAQGMFGDAAFVPLRRIRGAVLPWRSASSQRNCSCPDWIRSRTPDRFGRSYGQHVRHGREKQSHL